MAPPSDLDLLERHAPIVRFNEGEYFLPASVEAFVDRSTLWQRTGPTSRRLVATAGTLDVDGLVEATTGHLAQHYLQLVTQPLPYGERIAWRQRKDRPRFRAETRLGRVGVLARLVDAFGRASLLMRGTVPRGTEATAAVADRDRPDHGDHPYYGRVVRAAGYVVLQYWWFYFFNDWRSRARGFNDHEGDWEQVTLYLVEQGDDEPTPTWVAFSAHDEAGPDLRRRWDDPDLTIIDGHPVVHAGLGSHAGAFLAGEYLTSVRSSRLAGVASIGRRLSRLLLPWTRGTTAEGLGIPYVDYKRGDGVTIGVGQQHRWRAVLIDDDTAWVRDYTGLWGNDTYDRFGGERGPAGPRYERDATVRRSWSDPVGWAGLDAVAPDEATRRALVERRIGELDRELTGLEQERSALRDRLRADLVGASASTGLEETELTVLSARTSAVGEERRRLRRSLEHVPDVPPPHAHLLHRPLPMPIESEGRRRLLRAWAALSTPLVFALLAALVLGTGPSTWTLAGAGLLAIFTIEAVARGRLFGFLVGLAAVTVAVLVVIGVVSALVRNWQLTLAGLLAAVGLALLVLNVRELRRS